MVKRKIKMFILLLVMCLTSTFVLAMANLDAFAASCIPSRTSISVSNSSPNILKATWKKVSRNCDGYQVIIASDSKFTSNKKTYTVPKSYTSKLISGLTGTKYAKVRAYNKVGKKTYYASYSSVKSVYVKNSYKIYYYSNNATTGNMKPSSHVYGMSKSLSVCNYSKTGYAFVGWSKSTTGNVKYKDKQLVKNLTAIPNGIIKLYANWAPINYKITYNLDGGTASNNLVTYNVATKTFRLNNPTRLGYDFIGWTGSNGIIPQKTVILPLGSFGNKTYTANWVANNGEITNYTLNEIEANDHLFAIGATKPEYVVAQYNDDYSKVTITKNGTSSDGIMDSLDMKNRFAYKNLDLRSVIIGSGVFNIGNNAFDGCRHLTSIYISNSVTNIGAFAFSFCTSLTSMNIPDSVASIDNNAFYYCKNLRSINVPDGVRSISKGVFNGCQNLISVNIPDSVTNIGDYAFDDCDNLEFIEIPDSVQNIGRNAFYGCKSLESVNIPAGVTNISEYTFNSCSSLKYIKIPDNVQNIGNRAFCYCTNLKSIDIPGGVISIDDGTFYGCLKLTAINIDESNQNYSSINGVLFNKTQTDIICYPAGKTDTSYNIPNSVTNINCHAFEYCTNLTSINVPNSVIAIDNYSFGDCDNLTINCEASSKPSSWNTNWNYFNRPVNWGVSM